MRALFTLFAIWTATSLTVQAQKLWTETDRSYLLENMKRTRDEIIRETENLTVSQWNFRETATRWNIAEILEHLGYWEMLFTRQAEIALESKPVADPVRIRKTDSYWLDWTLDPKIASKASEYSTPTGFIKNRDNLTFFLRLREQTIRLLETTDVDLRRYFEPGGDDLHQMYVIEWAHCDRHLRQLRKVKAHPDFPKAGH